jgi:hypothetical protein
MDTTSRQEDKFPSRDSRVWQDSQEKGTAVVSHYTVRSDDDYVLVDTTSGAVTITLPSTISRRKLTIIRTAGANNVTISPSGTDTIDGAASKTISVSYTPVRLKGFSGGYLSV